MSRPTMLSLLSVTLLVLSALPIGCGRPDVIIVPAGEPIQLAETVQAQVYYRIKGGDGEVYVRKSPNRVTIPHGWWCLPDPGPDRDNEDTE